jgi:hypothetical protein
MLRWEQKRLAEAASISIEPVTRIEVIAGPVSAHSLTVDSIQRALEAAGVIFIESNGDGPGGRLKKGPQS